MRRTSCAVLAVLVIFCLSACKNKKSSDDSAGGLPGNAVDFAASPLIGNPPLTVQFTDMSIGTNISIWTWNFGDGGSSNNQHPQHIYEQDGCFDVTLHITDDFGTRSLTKVGYIFVGEYITGGDTGHDAGSGMYTVKDMFEYLNYMREIYAGVGGHGTAPHGGYDGYPWEGTGLPESQPYSWSITFKWDKELAEEAQAEAERLRDGGTPTGRRFSHQGMGGEPMWLNGLNLPKYMASGLSESSTSDYPWWKNNNGTARMGLHYQTGTAPYNHKTRIGIGKADTGVNDVWWVFIYGEGR